MHLRNHFYLRNETDSSCSDALSADDLKSSAVLLLVSTSLVGHSRSLDGAALAFVRGHTNNDSPADSVF